MAHLIPNTTTEVWQISPSPADLASLASRARMAAEDRAAPPLQGAQSKRYRQSETRRRVASRIARVGSVLRAGSDQLRAEDERVAQYFAETAAHLQRLASYVDAADRTTLARDLRQIASERPLWLFGTTLLVGLAAGRLSGSLLGSERSHATV